MSLNKETAARLCAVLWLSAKYFITHLRTAVSYAFQDKYPPYLSSWETSQKDWKYIAIQPFEFSVANTLREARLLTPLPALLYRLARGLFPSNIFEANLHSENKKSIFLFHDLVQQYIVEFIESAFNFIPEHGDCRSRVSCTQARERLRFSVIRAHAAGTGTAAWYDPLYFEEERMLADLDLCSSCQHILILKVTSARRSFWTCLPTYFEMPDWETLQRADEEYHYITRR